MSQIGSQTEIFGSVICGDAFEVGCDIQMHKTIFVDVMLMSAA